MALKEYDQILARGSSEEANEYDLMLQEQATAESRALKLSMHAAGATTPDRAAKALDLSQRTGLPYRLVERNLDTVQQRDLVQRNDYDAILERAPGLATWLTDAPEHAAIAHDDLDNLGTLEWLIKAPPRAFAQGEAQVQLGQLGYRAIFNEPSPAQHAEMARLQQAAQAGGELGARSLPRKLVTGLAGYLPQLREQLTRGVQTGLPIGMELAGIAALAGQAGPQVAIPEELVTVPAAFVTGVGIGTLTEMTTFNFQQEAGGALLEFQQFRDEHGEPLDPGIAKVAALTAGALNAGLETVQVGALLRTIPGGEKLLGAGARGLVRRALASPTVRGALAQLAKTYAGTLTFETATEVVQRAVTIMAGELAKTASGQGFEMRGAGDIGADLVSEAVGAAQSFALALVPGPALRFGMQSYQARRAQAQARVFEALGDSAKASKLRERLPEKYRELVDRLTKDGPIENVYIDAGTWQSYWQSKNADPRQVAAAVLGDVKTYDQAVLEGTDIVIPTAGYAATIAPTEHNAALAREIRVAPDAMSANEGDAWIEAHQQAAAQAEQISAEMQSAAQVREDLVGQLLGAGFERGTAVAYADLYESAFRSLGQRAGIDPLALFQRYGLTVERELPEVLRQVSRTDKLDLVINRLRAGEIPTDREIFGPSLVDFLVEKGGLQDQGGELSARDAQKARRGLVKKKGMTLDHAAELAVEAGYLSERDPNTLLAAIDEELAGRAQFAGAVAGQRLDVKATLEGLGEFLDQAGIDLQAVDNQAIKQLLRRGEAEGRPGTTELTQDERGRIRFGPDRQFNVRLLKGADLSTFLHETGHLYLEILGDLATREEVSEELTTDYRTVLDWLGVKDRSEITAAHHEQFARGFEAYLFEGRAPSTALARAFAKFRAWLISIYRSLQRLNVALTDDVRAVMDRLVATEEELAAAQAHAALLPLYSEAHKAGMTEQQFAQYQQAVRDAREGAEVQLTRRILTEVQREQKKWWKDQRAEVLAEVEREVNEQPVYVALSVMQRATLPDGSALPEGMRAVKLNRQALIDGYGESFLKHLPRPYVYAKEGGVHPDVAADLFGFKDGDALVQALVNARSRRQLIEAETDARMADRFGDLRLDGTIAAEAMSAVHGVARGDLLVMELKYLATRTRRRVPPRELVRQTAEAAIAEKRVRDVRPALYERAETKASREAIEAAARDRFDEAFDAKSRELLQHELYREASNAREEVDNIVAYMGKFSKRAVRERLGLAGAEYLDQIDAILERFDFRKGISLKEIERRKALVQWVEEQNELGFTVDLPPRLLAEAYRRHWKDLPIEELRGIRDGVKTIEHLARLKNKLLANARTADLEQARAEIIASIGAHHAFKAEPPDFAPPLRGRIKENARGFFAAHTKPEFLFEYLDGNEPQGPVWQHLFKPFADAENKENAMMREVTENLARIFKAYPRRERATWFFRKVYIPEIGVSLTKANMLAVALNQGNLYNREALMRGYGWTEEQVQAVLDKLDKKDWDTVQAVWDYIDSFWPQIEEQERALNGIAPRKVDATPVDTNHGRYRGGYYPIVFDAKLSWRQSVLEEKAHVRDLFGGHWARAMTRHGHTIERSNTGGKPVRLDLSGMTEHLTNVVHDLSFRAPLIDVGRLVNDRDIRQVIESAMGREYYKQLNPWLVAMAADRRDTTNPLEGLLGRARVGATVVSMGWKLTTAIVQPLGYTVSIKELGAKYAALGLRDVYAQPHRLAERWDFVTSRSEFMANRLRQYDRDVRDALKRLNVAGVKPGALSVIDAYTQGLKESYFAFIGYMDMSVSLPSWLGAYRKAMDGAIANVVGGDEQAAIDYADQVVRITQGSGTAKDLALVQRGPEAFRIFTMFYSYFSVLFNQMAKTTRQFKLDKNAPRLLASLALLWFVPAVLEDLITGRGPDDDAGDDEWLKWLLGREVAYPFQSVVFVRDVVNGMDRYGYEPSAAFDMYEQLARAGKLAIAISPLGDKDEVTRADVKGLALATGYVLQLPARQMWLTAEYLYDWMTGEVSPEQPAEAAWRTFVTGKPRERR
jgi:Large polyvalent protein associated domain 22